MQRPFVSAYKPEVPPEERVAVGVTLDDVEWLQREIGWLKGRVQALERWQASVEAFETRRARERAARTAIPQRTRRKGKGT